MDSTGNAIQLYISKDGAVQLNVSLDQDTVWLTQVQLSELFDTSVDNISLHFKNIFGEGELSEKATTEDYSIVRKEGARNVKRKIKHYNLDAIISVGYRVNSSRSTQFRQWATQTLKQHLVDGYTLNESRLQGRGIEIEQAVSLLSRTLANQQLVSPDGEAVISVINDYARSWSLLQGYDEQSLANQEAKQGDMKSLAFDEVLKAVGELKRDLIAKGEAAIICSASR